MYFFIFFPIHFKDKFVQYFWEVMNKITSSSLPILPYFNILTVLGIYTFIKEKIDIGIFEVGIGGDLDCTNVFEHPIATAVFLIIFF